jgi:hypothetical protein
MDLRFGMNRSCWVMLGDEGSRDDRALSLPLPPLPFFAEVLRGDA